VAVDELMVDKQYW